MGLEKLIYEGRLKELNTYNLAECQINANIVGFIALVVSRPFDEFIWSIYDNKVLCPELFACMGPERDHNNTAGRMKRR